MKVLIFRCLVKMVKMSLQLLGFAFFLIFIPLQCSDELFIYSKIKNKEGKERDVQACF